MAGWLGGLTPFLPLPHANPLPGSIKTHQPRKKQIHPSLGCGFVAGFRRGFRRGREGTRLAQGGGWLGEPVPVPYLLEQCKYLANMKDSPSENVSPAAYSSPTPPEDRRHRLETGTEAGEMSPDSGNRRRRIQSACSRLRRKLGSKPWLEPIHPRRHSSAPWRRSEPIWPGPVWTSRPSRSTTGCGWNFGLRTAP